MAPLLESGFLRPFRHRNYRLFFSGQLVSLVGTWMQSVAQSWLVYTLTGSGFWLGAVGFAGQFPVFCLGMLGGAAADQYDRRKILVFTQAASMLLALGLAALTFTGHVAVWNIILLACGLGLVNALDIPARQSFVVDMVGRADLPNAIGLNSSMFNGARILGPTLAGILVAAVGEGWCFLLNGASYVAVILGLLAMRVDKKAPAAHGGRALARAREGFAFAWKHRRIRAILMLIGLGSLLGVPYIVLMPIFADTILGSGARGLGLLMGCSGGGALLGALTLAVRRSSVGLEKLVLWASAGFGATLIGFAFSTNLALSCVLLVPVGYCMVAFMASANTLLQLASPDAMRGRIMALFSMMYMGMAPIGALLAGILSNVLGAPLTVALGGVACALGAGTLGLKLLSLPDEPEEAPAPGS